jgi:copper chaperone CopZ
MKIYGIKRWGLVRGLVAGLLLLTAAWGAQLRSGAMQNGQSWGATGREVVTSVFKVDNLSCSACLDTIGSELQGLQGTVGFDADLANQVVFVDHQRELSAVKIGEKITAIGYPARLLGSGEKIQRVLSAGSVQKAAETPVSGCNRRLCGATARDWKELYHRIFTK